MKLKQRGRALSANLPTWNRSFWVWGLKSDMSAHNEDSALHKAIISAWDCALADTRVTYLSGPITTGFRYAQQVRSGVSADAARERAKQENIDDLLATAKQLRRQRGEIIVEPASLHLPEWSQAEYHRLWEKLIERHARLVIFMPGWEYSVGCALEFAHASVHDIRTEALSGRSLSLIDGIAFLSTASKNLRSGDVGRTLAGLADRLDEVIARLKQLLSPAKIASQNLRKDASLDFLAERGMNVAQFVSFAPKNGK